MNRNSKTPESRPKRRGIVLSTMVASAAIAGGIIIPASSAMAAPATSVAHVVAHKDHHSKPKHKKHAHNTQGGTQGGGDGNTQGGTQGGGSGNTQGGTQGGGDGNTQGGTQGGGSGNTQGGTQGGGDGNTQGGTQG
ncbi:hypothetical protein [Streptomyces sp. NPDC001250]|uniref:hypothetical protein n=1 Tax=Streptomyces sp. NPDC001250 TaxID=3154382 RepID=UPI003328B0B1